MGDGEVVSIAEVSRRAEKIGPDLEAQIRERVYDDTIIWLQKTMPERLRQAYPAGNNQENKIQLADGESMPNFATDPIDTVKNWIESNLPEELQTVALDKIRELRGEEKLINPPSL